MRGDGADDGVDVVAVADIKRPGFCAAAAGCDLVSDGLRAIRGIIGDGDIGAFGREHPRGGAAHAAGRAGNEYGQSLNRAAELFEFSHRILADEAFGLQD